MQQQQQQYEQQLESSQSESAAVRRLGGNGGVRNARQAFAVGGAHNSALGDDRRHVLMRRHIERRIYPDAIRRHLFAGNVGDFLAERCSIGIWLPSGVFKITVENGAAT